MSDGLRRLTAASTGEGRVQFVQEIDTPVYMGQGEGTGTDLLCAGGCGAVLAADVVQGEVWDVVILCRRCGALSDVRAPPPGHPLPFHTIAVAPGLYQLQGPIENRAPVVLTSTLVSERRWMEVGAGYRPADLVLNTGADVEGLLARADAIFGKEFIEKLVRRDKRLDSPGSTSARNWLARFVRGARASAVNIEGESPSIDAPSVFGLHVAIELFERWTKDPATARIAKEVGSPDGLLHAVATLGTATHLHRLGNAAGLQAPVAGSRSADIYVLPRPGQRLNAEVKIPRGLVRPTRPLDAVSATKALQAAWKKADTGAAGQLSPANPGILVVAGWQLSQEDQKVLERAANDHMKAKGGKRTHIAAIALMSFGLLVGDAGGGRPTMSGVLGVSLAMNPKYDGGAQISDAVPTDAGKLIGDIVDTRFPWRPPSADNPT